MVVEITAVNREKGSATFARHLIEISFRFLILTTVISITNPQEWIAERPSNEWL